MRLTAATGSAGFTERRAISASRSSLGGEAADLVGVERDGRDDDGVLGEVVAEGGGTDAGSPQQLRRAERVRGDDDQVGRHESASRACAGPRP